MAMYPNLAAEMARRNVRSDDIAKSINVCNRTARNKLAGRVPFTWPEAKTIRNQFFPDIAMDVLFETDNGPIVA